jgi:hypothetical protein
MPKPTPYLPPPDRPTDQAVSTTALCGAHRHELCPGKIVSATPAHGQPCACSCHDQAAEHVGEVA